MAVLEGDTDAGAILLFRELRLANEGQAPTEFMAEAEAETTALLALLMRLNPGATKDALAQVTEWTED
jgi:hypothetical protein